MTSSVQPPQRAYVVPNLAARLREFTFAGDLAPKLLDYPRIAIGIPETRISRPRRFLNLRRQDYSTSGQICCSGFQAARTQDHAFHRASRHPVVFQDESDCRLAANWAHLQPAEPLSASKLVSRGTIDVASIRIWLRHAPQDLRDTP